MGASDLVRNTLNFLQRRKRSYQLCFDSPAGNEVMIDLVKFCRATRSCFSADARMHAVYEGRREVFLRIAQHLNLTTDQLFDLYNDRNILQPAKEGDDN